MSERHNPAAYPKLVTITPPSLQGLPFALAYPKLVNDSVHSLHMASHIFLRMGDFAKVKPGVVSEAGPLRFTLAIILLIFVLTLLLLQAVKANRGRSRRILVVHCSCSPAPPSDAPPSRSPTHAGRRGRCILGPRR